MAKVRSVSPLLVVIAALLACATTPPRLLDEACRDRRCTTTGSARETTGLTADSIGFVLGPGPGRVTIPMDDSGAFTYDALELLVKGSGSVVVTVDRGQCSSCGSRSIELQDEWRWEPGGSTVFGFGFDTSPFTIVVETLDDSSRAELLDLRLR